MRSEGAREKIGERGRSSYKDAVESVEEGDTLWRDVEAWQKLFNKTVYRSERW